MEYLLVLFDAAGFDVELEVELVAKAFQFALMLLGSKHNKVGSLYVSAVRLVQCILVELFNLLGYVFKLLPRLARIISLYHEVLVTTLALCLFLTGLDCFLQFAHSRVCSEYLLALDIQLLLIHLRIRRVQQQGLNSIRSPTNVIMSERPYRHLINLWRADKNFVIILMIWLLPDCLEVMFCSTTHRIWSSCYRPLRILDT